MGKVPSVLAICTLLAVPPAPAPAVTAIAARMDRAATFYQNRDGSNFYLTNQEVELTFDHSVPDSLEFAHFSGLGGALFMRVPGDGTQAPDHQPGKNAAPPHPLQ